MLNNQKHALRSFDSPCAQVYGPDGLGKTAMGGHPRRRLSQASVLETGPPPAINGTGAHAKSGSLPIATAAGGGALALDTPAASGGPLSKAGVLDEGLDEGFDEDGGMEDDEDARRTQLQEAGALRAQQQAAAAFRVDPGLQEARNLVDCRLCRPLLRLLRCDKSIRRYNIEDGIALDEQYKTGRMHVTLTPSVGRAGCKRTWGGSSRSRLIRGM